MTMGTNFYNKVTEQHIGKRSAAGVYCWDCRVSLRRGGESEVHSGGRYIMTYPSSQWAAERAKEWHEVCPQCGNRPAEEGIDESSAGRELGFNTDPPKRKKGVSSCSSFSWAIEPEDLKGVGAILDEYDHEYTAEDFAAALKECPIQFRDSIGMEFC
jgi:hypothetical protein